MEETEKKFHQYLSAEPKEILKRIAKEKELTSEIEEDLKKVIEDFKATL